MSNMARQDQAASKIVGTHANADDASMRLRLRHPRLIGVDSLCKSYRKGVHEIPVLKGVSMEIPEGQFTAIVGQSGSGKSTLLHLLGTLDAPDQGEIWFQDRRIDNLPAREREKLRNQEFGLVFQFYHLLPELSTLENVLMPMMVKDGIWGYLKNRKNYKRKATELLELVGMGHRLTHKPSELSGGEMQRAAIARALVTSPSLLLADEPTGNLDAENGHDVMEVFLELNRRENLTIVMVTHDNSVAEQADHVVRLKDGLVEA